MNKILMCLFAFFSCSTSMLAQEDTGKQSREERIKAIKVAFITEELGLTSKESQDFWPLYNEMEQKVKVYKKLTKAKPSDLELLPDSELEQKMETILQSEEQVIAVKREYIIKLKEVISIRQIAKLMGLERKFKKELLQHVRRHRDDRSNGRRG